MSSRIELDLHGALVQANIQRLRAARHLAYVQFAERRATAPVKEG